MKIIEPGHVYQLQHFDGTGAGMLVFVNREAGTEHEGTQTQEVLRALIDRTQHCDRCLRWEGNDEIIAALRRALVLHEARALERKTDKGHLEPEKIATGPDGHFAVKHSEEDHTNGCTERCYAATRHITKPLAAPREKIKLNGKDPEVQKIMAASRRAAAEVSHWPDWKLGTMERPTGEVGWLIEDKASRSSWWDGKSWTRDSNQAVRFARKEDGEAIVAGLNFAEVVVTEHMWCP